MMEAVPFKRQYTRPLNRWHDEVGLYHIEKPGTSPVWLLCGSSGYYSLGGDPGFVPDENQTCKSCLRAARKREKPSTPSNSGRSASRGAQAT